MSRSRGQYRATLLGFEGMSEVLLQVGVIEAC